MREGFEGYREFAPAGWSPPSHVQQSDYLQRGLRERHVWCLAGEREGEPAGHVAFVPAARTGWGDAGEPALAHLWQLFVRRPHWGHGLAGALLAAACAEAPRHGFVAMRLFTPAEHARARCFYEREGWAVGGPSFANPQLGLPLIEYRRGL